MEELEISEAHYNHITRAFMVFHRKADGKYYIKAGLVTMPRVKTWIDKQPKPEEKTKN